MDFKIVLALIVLCALKISCHVSLVSNIDPQECIIEETVVTLTCTVEDRNNGNGATVINGSQSIFDCPSVSKVENNKLYLRHSHMKSATAICGELVSGRIVEVQNGTYITQIYITTNVSMNEGYVECRVFGKQGSSRIQLANIKALPHRPTLYVEFFDNLFHIHWNQYEGLTKISDSHFSIEVIGEDCGNCTNFGIASNVTNQLSCTGWEPNGQVCNVTVTAVASVCGLQQFISASRPVYLKVPEAPLLENIMPAYSYDLEELQSIQILLAVESTVDLNGLPITFQVSVNRSSGRWDNNPICSLKISADSKCIANADALVQYRCEINFPVYSSCQELFLQPEQDTAYQIGIFAESSIGRSSLSFSNIPSYANLTVQFLFTDPQQSPKIYNFISVYFPQLHDNVTSMIKYGSNCQALDNQMTIVGFNVTTLTFPVPGTMDDICWIVTISNISQSLAFQGSFSAVDLNSPDAYQVSFDYSISAVCIAAFVLFIITYTPAVTWYTRRKYSKNTIKIQTNSTIKSELLSSGAEHNNTK